jgi:hypothetical protein
MFQPPARQAGNASARVPTQGREEVKPGRAAGVKWQGPTESGLGWHLIWIESTMLGRAPGFEEVEARVKSEWSDEQRVESKRKLFDRMKAPYQIVLPEAAPATSGSAVTHAAAASR